MSKVVAGVTVEDAPKPEVCLCRGCSAWGFSNYAGNVGYCGPCHRAGCDGISPCKCAAGEGAYADPEDE